MMHYTVPALSTVTLLALGFEMWVFTQRTEEPGAPPRFRDVRRLARRLLPTIGPALMIFTFDGCPGCSMVSAWRDDWTDRWRAAGQLAPPMVIVGEDIQMSTQEIIRAGIHAVPSVALLDRKGRVQLTDVGFNRGLWNRYVEQLLAETRGAN